MRKEGLITKKLWLKYVILLAVILCSVLIRHLWGTSVFGFSVVFLTLVFVPGYLLTQLFKIYFEDDLIGNVVLWLALGLALPLVLAFLGIFVGLTISALLWLYLILITILIVLMAIFDSVNKSTPTPTAADFRKLFQGNPLILILSLSIIMISVLTLTPAKSSFTGDPLYHIAIMAKVLGGKPLFSENLNYIKLDSVNIAYGFPIWHIFLSLLAKISKLSAFEVWAQIIYPLFFIMTLVWYWLLRRIFPSRNLALLGVILLLAINLVYDGYIFTRVTVPDTFNQLIFLPLVVGLALKFIYEPKLNIRVLVLGSVLLFLLAAKHLTQYLYFECIFAAFFIVFLFWPIKKPNFRATLGRIGLILGVNLVVVVPFLTYLMARNKSVADSLVTNIASVAPGHISSSIFTKVKLLSQLSYLFAPILLILSRKNQKYLFLLTIFLLVPLIYFGFFRTLLARLFGEIMFDRFAQNVIWDFAIWALFIAFVLWVFEKIISELSFSFKRVIAALLIVVSTILLFIQLSFGSLEKFYSLVFPNGLESWLGSYGLWVLLPLTLLAFLFAILIRFPEKIDFDHLEHFSLASFILLFIIFLFLFSPYTKTFSANIGWRNLKVRFFEPHPPNAFAEVLAPVAYRGEDAAVFINQNLPAKSVIMVPDAASLYIPEVTDQFMVAYSRTETLTDYLKIYDPTISVENQKTILQKSGAQYILLVPEVASSQVIFDQNPEMYTKIFEQTSIIYQVNPNF